MSWVRVLPGSECTVMARYDPCSFETHSALSIPGTLTKNVSMGCGGVTHEGGSADIALTILPPIPAGKYACNSPLPPLSAAGFVQPAAIASSFTRPKRLFAGGGAFARKET